MTTNLWECMVRASREVAQQLDAGGPGSGPQGGPKSYPTKAQSDRAVKTSNKEIADAKQALSHAETKMAATQAVVKELTNKLSGLDAQRAAIMEKLNASKQRMDALKKQQAALKVAK